MYFILNNDDGRDVTKKIKEKEGESRTIRGNRILSI